jgi:pilus assembly protein CpaF
MSLETIFPYLQPIADLITDPGVSEVMVNGGGAVFIQRNGKVLPIAVTIDPRHLLTAIKRIARSLGKDISETKPLLDARLADGSRVAAAFPPCSPYGPCLTIRKFRPHWYSLDQLVEAEALPRSVADLLKQAVLDRKTILVSGGTDSGKTTFTKALLDCIPQEERLAVIEDTLELKIDHPNTLRFEVRLEMVDPVGTVTAPAVTVRDLVKATLRHRPDRLIIGEVRGGEAFDLLDALNTGHAGSISTLHANSALQALSRLASMALRAGVDIPYRALQMEIGDLIDLVLHVERRHERRYLSQLLQVDGFDPNTNSYQATSLSGA